MTKRRELRILLQLHRATHQIGLYIAGLKNINVSQADAIILAYLSDHHRATMSELHRAFGHRRSTLTSVVDRLVGRGLAKRDVSADDRRSFVVSLSRKGSALASELYARLYDLESAALQKFSDRDVAMLRNLLAQLEVNKRRR